MVFNDDARTKLKKGIDTLADAVQITLGPKGRNVLINSHLTKDGITVAKAVNLEDYVEDFHEKVFKTSPQIKNVKFEGMYGSSSKYYVATDDANWTLWIKNKMA